MCHIGRTLDWLCIIISIFLQFQVCWLDYAPWSVSGVTVPMWSKYYLDCCLCCPFYESIFSMSVRIFSYLHDIEKREQMVTMTVPLLSLQHS